MRGRGRNGFWKHEPLDTLADSAVVVVVGVEDADCAVGEGGAAHGDEAVLGVVGVPEHTIGNEVAVGVV